MSEEFLKAAEEVKKLAQMPSNDTLSELYGLYKQATDGDNNKRDPTIFFYKDQMKWKAWKKHWGMSKKKAEAEYIALVESLKSKK